MYQAGTKKYGNWLLTIASLAVGHAVFVSGQVSRAQQEEQKEEQPADPPKDEAPDNEKEAQTGDKPEKIEIDPELQKRIDEMLEKDRQRKQELHEQIQGDQPAGGRTPARRPTRPPVRPQPQPAVTPPGDQQPIQPAVVPGTQPAAAATEERSDSTPLNIEPVFDDIPPEARKYRFSIKDGSYEQLVEGFARQTGLGVIGDAPKEGKVTFVSTEELTFNDALGRVRMLLFKYKPHEPYWLERRETHLEVIRVTDFYRILPPDRMYPSIDAMRGASLRPDELALVVYTPTTGSVGDLQMVRDFLPDYVRVTPMGGSSVTLFALVKDIEKYLWLVDFFSTRSNADPRQMERIEVINLLPSQALATLQQLENFGDVGSVRPRVRSPQPSPLDVMSEPATTLIPDDAQGVLIVLAMKDKLERIKKLLAFIDVSLPAPDNKPTIIPVQYTLPDQLINTIQLVISSGAPAGAAPAPAGRRRPRAQPGASTASVAVSGDGVSMFPHPSLSAIIVIADAPSVERIRELVAQFDVKSETGPTRITLNHADATEVSTTVPMVLGGSGDPRAKAAAGRFQLVPDTSNTAVWFVGTSADLGLVREIIAMIDVPSDPVSLRIVSLLHQQASFVANLLKEMDSGTASGGTPAAARGRAPARRARSVVASKFTPDDANHRLYILCTDAEWQDYRAIIEKVDIPAAGEVGFVRLSVTHVGADDVIDQLMQLMQTGDPRDAAVRFISTGDAILVLGANEPQLNRLRSLIREFDKPVELDDRTFEIKHADMATIKTAIETFIGTGVSEASRTPRRRRADPKAGAAMPTMIGSDLTLVEVGQKLVVRTTRSKMEEVARLIEQFDVPPAPDETRVYSNFPPGTDVSIVADSLLAMMPGTSVTGPGQPGRQQQAASAGPRFIPLLATSRLIIIARPEQFTEIERMIELLKGDIRVEPTAVAYIDVKHVDAQELVDQILPLLELKTRELSQIDPQTTTAVAATQPQPMTRRRGITGPTSAEFQLLADVRNRRVVIAARQAIIEHTRELVSQFDQPYQAEVVFRTVALENSDAPTMVKAIREMLGTRPGRPARRAPAAQPGLPESADTTPLTVVEAPGGASIVLHGMLRDVDEAEVWINHLDSIATTGKLVKVYDIHYADIKMLGDLIMNVIDRQTSAAGPQVRRPRRPPGMVGLEAEEDEFELTKTWVGQDVYIQGDLIGKVMIVAASEGKIAEVDRLVDQFDTEETETRHASVPSFTYSLKHVDSFDAEFSLESVIDEYWEGSDKPQVSGAMFGNYLIVKHPDKSQFQQIKDWIEEFVDKPDPKKSETIRRTIAVPTGATPDFVARWLQDKLPDIEFEIHRAPVPKDQTHGLEVLTVGPASEPASNRNNANPCVLPAALVEAVNGILTVLPAQNEDQPPPEDQPEEDQAEPEAQPQPIEEEPIDEPVEDDATYEMTPELREQMIRAQTQPVEQDAPREKTSDDDEDRKPRRPAPSLEGKKVIIYLDGLGNVIAESEAGVLDQIPDWIDDLKEELEDLKVPPDIRIVRLRYVDVNYAAEILEEMFNASRQQRAAVEAASRRAAQVAAQQQRAQQRAQQQPQRGEEQGGGRGQQQPQQPQQQVPQVPELPPENVRVFPNPRDRTLILRADTNQYSAIFELLAKIDQPKPIESELKVFMLTKLNAEEVAEMLTEMLGLGGAARPTSRPRRAAPGEGGASGGSAAEALPKSILQKTVTGTNELSVDPSDINLSANAAANAIVVMAPPKAIEFIGALINQLENENIPEREPRYFELLHADAVDVADFLDKQFEASGGPSRRPGKSASADSLNTPTFIPYPRLKLITAVATVDQLKKVEDTIARLDVQSDQDQWRYFNLAHADAKFAADTLGAMFAGARAPSATPGRSAPSAVGSAGGPVFLGQEGGRMLVFKTPESLVSSIDEAIAKIEADAAQVGSVRTILLQNAQAAKVAGAIEKSFPAAGGSRGGRSAASRISISADDNTGTLFVVADDESFARVESLVRILDKPSEIKADFRIYPLKFAEARKVHTIMSKMIQDYLRMLGPNRGGLDAFSVEPDDQTNSLIVLGGQQIFDFVESSLPKVDNPANVPSPPATLMVALKNARAEEVAATVNRLYAQRAQEKGETPPQADANRSLNTLIVRGTQKQIDEIKKEFVDPLESQGVTAMTTETITLQFADAESVAEQIARIYEDRRKMQQVLGSAGNVSPTDSAVAVTPNVPARQIIVQATEDNLRFIREIVATLDKEENAELAAVSVRVYPVQNTDTDALVRIITEWSRARQQMSGRSQRTEAAEIVSATAEPMTQSVVVTASEASHVIITEMIQNLDKESSGAKALHRVKLEKADAESLAKTLGELYRGRSQARRGQQPVQVTAEKATNTLLIVANDVEMAEINTLLASLDVDPDPSRRLLKSIKLTHADPWTVTDAISQLFRPGVGGRDPRDAITSVPDGASRSVIVAAAPEDMRRVEELIAQVDTEEGSRQDVHVIHIANADPQGLAQTLTEIFVRSLPKQGSQGPAITIAALAGSKALLVKAGAEDLQEIKIAIEQLDTDVAQLGEEVRIVPLLYADATEVEAAMRKYLQSPGGGRGQSELVGDMRLAVLAQSNSIVVSGAKDSVERIAQLAAQMDTTGEKGSVPQIIKLQHAGVGQLLPNLQEMFTQQSGGGRRAQPPPVLVGNDTLNALIVRASPTDFAAIESLVQQLDTEEYAAGEAVRLIQVSQNINIEDFAGMIQDSINEGARVRASGSGRGADTQQIRILPDRRSGTLIVSGHASLFDETEKLVRKLEEMGPKGGVAVKVISLGNVAGDEVTQLISLLKGEEGSGRGASRPRTTPARPRAEPSRPRRP